MADIHTESVFGDAIVTVMNLLAERRQALIAAPVTSQFDVFTAFGRGVDVS